MAKEIKTIGVLTSGGDAPGMNAAIRAVVRTALNKGLKVKGIQKGYNGLLNDEIIDMDKRSVADIIQRGGTVLYTARCMEFMTEEGQKRGAEVCRKHGIDGIVVIGGDGSFRGAQKLAAQGINTIGLPGTIDLDIACTDYTIGFDTAVNTAMEAIDKIRDTSTSHERCSIIEVMGRNAGYIALWCGIANGAEDILLPERYDNDEQALINHIIEGRKKGKKHHLIINAEGIGHSTGMARRIEAATGIETRATILGYMQRGGSPTCKDRMYASIMGAYAVDLLAEGKSNRLVAYKDGKFVDYDIDEALAMIPKEGQKESASFLIIKQIQAIYREEGKLKELSSKERLVQRQVVVKPLVDALFVYLKQHESEVGTEKVREAFTYALNQEKYLRVFLTDGDVPMDNNASERAIRGFCVGKKNWQMIDTINGAKSSDIIYSIAETAKANNLKPYEYFEYLLTEIPKHMDDTDRSFLNDLVPWSEKLPENIRKPKN